MLHKAKPHPFWRMNTYKIEQHKTFDPGGDIFINRTDLYYNEQIRIDIKDCQFLPNIFSIKFVRAGLPRLLKILILNFKLKKNSLEGNKNKLYIHEF